MNAEVEHILCKGLSQETSMWMIKSLKELSVDSATAEVLPLSDFWDSKHPTLSSCTAIDFDEIAKLYCTVNRLSYRCSSCDALYIAKRHSEEFPELYWIEFKNGKITSKVVKEINDKITCGNRILEDVGSLNSGTLQFITPSQPTLEGKSPNFGFGNRLTAIGIPESKMPYEKEHAHLIVVYNEDKKEELLNEDLDSICDEIERGYYQSLIQKVETTRSLLPIWSMLCSSTSRNQSISAKDLLIQILHNRKSKPCTMGWFENLSDFFDLCEKVSQGNLSNEISEWRSMDKSEISEFIDTIGIEISNTRKKQNRISLRRIQSVLQKSLSEQSDYHISFEEILQIGYEQSTAGVHYLISYLQKRLHKQALTHGVYTDLVKKLEDNPVLIPLEFNGTAYEYVQLRIDSGNFTQLLQECGNRNLYDATSFLNITTQCTIWPAAFFRFSQFNGFWYKDSYTYTRREFKEKFIDVVCQDCGDPKWALYDSEE